MFFWVIALTSFHKNHAHSKKLHPRTCKLSPSNRILEPWKSCFRPPGVWELLVGNYWARLAMWLSSSISLTPWLPGYKYILLWKCYFPGTLHLHSSPVDCARELFIHSKDLACLQVYNEKKWFWVSCFFRERRHNWGRVLAILACITWPRAQLLERSISLKFLLETKLESESFESFIDFLAFLVQKLWPKINEIINYLIIGLIISLFLCYNIWTQNWSKSLKVSKDLDFSLVYKKT